MNSMFSCYLLAAVAAEGPGASPQPVLVSAQVPDGPPQRDADFLAPLPTVMHHLSTCDARHALAVSPKVSHFKQLNMLPDQTYCQCACAVWSLGEVQGLAKVQ
jgi:hypothetical protein